MQCLFRVYMSQCTRGTWDPPRIDSTSFFRVGFWQLQVRIYGDIVWPVVQCCKLGYQFKEKPRGSPPQDLSLLVLIHTSRSISQVAVVMEMEDAVEIELEFSNDFKG